MMDYVCNSAVWSIVWFALGYAVCKVEANRRDENYRGKR